MAPSPSASKKTPTGRPRGRPPGSTNKPKTGIKPKPKANKARAARDAGPSATSEPPAKRRKYIPGGPGGGGRYVDQEEAARLAANAHNSVRAQRAAAAARKAAAAAAATGGTGAGSTSTVNTSVGRTSPAEKRERATRARTANNRTDDDDDLQITSAAAAAAVAQSEGYKPREERGWEEFHPDLDINGTFMIFKAEEVDGVPKSAPPTPLPPPALSQESSMASVASPTKDPSAASSNGVDTPSALDNPQVAASLGLAAATPARRRGRPPRYADANRPEPSSPKTPQVLPIHGQHSKEKLDLKLPSYRKTDAILLFESKTFGQARYVDKSMMNVGYQESDHFIRPDRFLLKASDWNMEEDAELLAMAKANGDISSTRQDPLGRVEYDMDEQDDMWLTAYNAQRKTYGAGEITREIFEITITKIEKEWHALEKRIPKPNPKPPQTHRPRSSSAAAVNGEPLPGEEVDSKCAICDDGDCENTNAIVFCDGCDLAVHQECYGVPFIPEGQWLCRKCQLIGRGIPTCIFCPNTDGAFKQTNSSKWAHLLCAMWIPEVSLGNHTFMEPVMDVEKVPKPRWRLTCYICQQKMGACIQCGNKSCYQAFHVTCARRARLYLKMKNSQGVLAAMDGNMVLKALCDKHSPGDYAKESRVTAATKAAQKFYKKSMKGRIWATNQDSARELAVTHRHAMTEHPPDESQMTGAKLSGMMGDKKKGQPGKAIWKLPSGAPIIPQAVFTLVDSALQRFTMQKRREFVSEACKYWTLKREARRGATLLKRLQLQMETFSSMELTRRNFAGMGPTGRVRLEKRIDFAKALLVDLESLKTMADTVVKRETKLLEEAEMQREFVDTVFFPIHRLLLPVLEKAFLYDKFVFHEHLVKLQAKFEQRYYTTVMPFAQDLCKAISLGINTEREPEETETKLDLMDVNIDKKNAYSDKRDRKRLGKRILTSARPLLESALNKECEVNNKPLEPLVKQLAVMIDAGLEYRELPAVSKVDGEAQPGHPSQDIEMADAPPVALPQPQPQPDTAAAAEEPTVESQLNGEAATVPVDAMDIDAEGEEEDADGEPDDTILPVHPPPPSTLPNGTSTNTQTSSVATPVIPPNGATTTTTSPTPPRPNGLIPAVEVHPPPSINATPPTPPQSNSSVGNGPTDPLTDGGVSWHFNGFKFLGTEASEERWAGRDAVRSLSEELTDIDDEEFRGLEETVMESPSTGKAVATPRPLKRPASSMSGEEPNGPVSSGAAAGDGEIKERVSSRLRGGQMEEEEAVVSAPDEMEVDTPAVKAKAAMATVKEEDVPEKKEEVQVEEDAALPPTPSLVPLAAVMEAEEPIPEPAPTAVPSMTPNTRRSRNAAAVAANNALLVTTNSPNTTDKAGEKTPKTTATQKKAIETEKKNKEKEEKDTHPPVTPTFTKRATRGSAAAQAAAEAAATGRAASAGRKGTRSSARRR